MNKFLKFLGFDGNKTTVKTEIIAGITTFMTMVYILMVNAGMFAEDWVGVTYGGAYIATAIGAIVGTLLMAFLAKMPLAQASGMGINAFIVYTLLLNGTGLTYANCMMFTLIDGVIFVLLTVTGLRKQIFDAIPASVRHAISVGIGLFIAFIGFQQAGIIVNDGSTLVTFVSFNLLKEGRSVFAMMTAAVAIVGVLVIAILEHKKVKGAILWGILGATVLYYAAAGIGAACGNAESIEMFEKITFSNPFTAFKEWGTDAFGKVFTEGFNFSSFTGTTGGLILLIVTTALSLCMIDMFDTIGTVIATANRAGMVDEEGNVPQMKEILLSDAIGTCVGAATGTSTVTTFVESASGVEAGGRTGLTSLTTGILFLACMFISPIAAIIPAAATSSALIYVGYLMICGLKNIDFTDSSVALPVSIMLLAMPISGSIGHGIGLGLISYTVIKVFTGKAKEVSVLTYVISAIFLVKFFLAI